MQHKINRSTLSRESHYIYKYCLLVKHSFELDAKCHAAVYTHSARPLTGALCVWPGARWAAGCIGSKTFVVTAHCLTKRFDKKNSDNIFLSEALLNDLGSVSPGVRGVAGYNGGSVFVPGSVRGSRVTGALCVWPGAPGAARCNGGSVCVPGIARGSRVTAALCVWLGARG